MQLKYASGEIALMTLYETEISFSKPLTYPAVRPTHVNQDVPTLPKITTRKTNNLQALRPARTGSLKINIK